MLVYCLAAVTLHMKLYYAILGVYIPNPKYIYIIHNIYIYMSHTSTTQIDAQSK